MIVELWLVFTPAVNNEGGGSVLHHVANPDPLSPPSGGPLIWPPSAEMQTLHHRHPPVSNKYKKRSAQSTLSYGYATAIIIRLQSRARRSHPHQRFSPTLSIALKHYWTTAEKHSQGHIPESAHRVSYLNSIELFQMKCTAVSHSPGLHFVCRLACMIHLFSCGRFAAGLLRCCSTRNTVRKVCSSLLELKVHTVTKSFVHCCIVVLICCYYLRCEV